MKNILKKYFGYDEFRPLQKEIVERTLAGQDSVVLMPTGGGKSLCFQLPALMQDGLTIVVSPLISLMKDQVDSLRSNGVAAELINSTLSPPEIASAMDRAMNGDIKILYVAPERFSVAGFEDFLHALKIDLIAIDEAHCISEWGHDFRPDYRSLRLLRRSFPSVPIMALTATATERVREDIVKQLGLKKPRTFTSSFNRPNLSYEVFPKKDALRTVVALLNGCKNESAIIYCFSRKDTEDLVEQLNECGFKAAAYHAGLDAETRKDNQERFIKDEINIMVATIAFGMGIDKPDVRLIIHHCLPKSIEGYYQETGRAGRDGLPARCVLLFSFADKFKQEYFIRDIADAAERRKAEQKLAQVLNYGYLKGCRRRFLLNYFNEEYPLASCGNCDGCVAMAPLDLATVNDRAARPWARHEVTINDYDMALFEELRSVRMQEARRAGVPPYVIFGDRTLREIATCLPRTTGEFLRVSGVGEQKLSQYGEMFMAVIRRYVAARGGHVATTGWSRVGSTYDGTRECLLKKMSIGEISIKRGLSAGTIVGHIEKIIAAEPQMDVSYLKPAPERLAKIIAAFKKTEGLALTPAREILGDDYSFDELRLARMFLTR